MRRPFLPPAPLLVLAALTPLTSFQVQAQGGQPTPPAASPASPASPVQTIEPATPLSLQTAITLALQHNPELRASARELEATRAAVGQAGALPNPELSMLIEDTRRETRTTTVVVNQPLELGGKRAARVSVAERAQESAEIDTRARRAQLRSDVAAAFFDVLAAQERARLSQGSVDLAGNASRAAGKRVTAGKISPVEETKAKVAESSARVEAAQALGELRTARQRLSSLWGNPIPRFQQADGQLDMLPPVPNDEGLETGLADSPALRQARNELARRQALTEVERARRIPDLTLTLGAKRDNELGRNQAVIGVAVPLPLFDTNRGNLAEALRRQDKAQDELAAARLRVSAELGEAAQRLRSMHAEATLLQREVLPGAQSAYDAAVQGFELGKFSFLEVLDAQRTLFQAKAQYLSALAGAHRAASDIDRLLGTDEDTAPVFAQP